MADEKRRLIKVFDSLDSSARRSLLDFADYLHQREATPDEESGEKAEPLHQPRPADENVVNAIKRLRGSYFMLDTDQLLNETSTLMAQFMMQGRPAEEVIDDLEALFAAYYQSYLDS